MVLSDTSVTPETSVLPFWQNHLSHRVFAISKATWLLFRGGYLCFMLGRFESESKGIMEEQLFFASWINIHTCRKKVKTFLLNAVNRFQNRLQVPVCLGVYGVTRLYPSRAPAAVAATTLPWAPNHRRIWISRELQRPETGDTVTTINQHELQSSSITKLQIASESITI